LFEGVHPFGLGKRALEKKILENFDNNMKKRKLPKNRKSEDQAPKY
jgi:hypothetical protein